MFLKGFDRAKYDLRDPSAWHALERDRALHEEALENVRRYLQSHTPQVHRVQTPVLHLAPIEQAALTHQLPTAMVAYERHSLPLGWLRKKF